MTTTNESVSPMTHSAMAYGLIEIHLRYDEDDPNQFYYYVASRRLSTVLTLKLLIALDQYFFGPIYLKLFDQTATINSPAFKETKWLP